MLTGTSWCPLTQPLIHYGKRNVILYNMAFAISKHSNCSIFLGSFNSTLVILAHAFMALTPKYDFPNNTTLNKKQ